jgi:type IV pilus assembly protein PilM
MSALAPLLARVRGFDPETLLNLRPSWPPVAVELDRGRIVLARIRRTRAKPVLEAYRIHETPDHHAAASLLRPNLGTPAELAGHLKEVFQKSGTKPGRVSVVLPDNLARVSIVSLPEKPAGPRELADVLRFRLRKSVPFRLEDAVISSWPVPGEGPGFDVLVAVMLRSTVEQVETAFDAVGARPGLVDLATPSVYNLARAELARITADGRDAALLNCALGYFTLLIVRRDRVSFYRCKSYANGNGDVGATTAIMARELASSLSYYQEKLQGAGIGTVLVRSVAQPLDEVRAVLERLGLTDVRSVDPRGSLDPAGASLDPAGAAGVTAALGAAAGRLAS